MGCGVSAARGDGLYPKNGPLSVSEIAQRLVVSETQEIACGAGLTLKVAAVSQRGYYPEALDKANQDAFIVAPCVEPTEGNNAAPPGLSPPLPRPQPPSGPDRAI